MLTDKNSVIKRLKSFPAHLQEIISLSRGLGRERGVGVYLVGGFVRDLLLGVKDYDLDIVVERDGIGFAHALCEKLKANFVGHKAFKTATIIKDDGTKIDVATSRKETYPAPAALPQVSEGAIEDDLMRRDFTINAIACHIDDGRFGELVDCCEGIADLKKKSIRVLHEKSFIDDPTRITRAVRFEQRLGFRIDAATRALMREARKKRMLEKVQKHRVRDELILIFKENDPAAAFKRLEQLYNVSFIEPTLRLPKDIKKKFGAIAGAHRWFVSSFPHRRVPELWLMYCASWVCALSPARLRRFLSAYAFRRGEALRMVSFQKEFPKIEALLSLRAVSNVALHSLLDPLSYEVIIASYALSKKEKVRRRIEEFFREHHHKKISVTGKDLLILGAKPGPHFAAILRKILHAKISGELVSRQEELAYAKRLIQKL